MTKLNPFILVVVDSQLNPDKYTLEQLRDNRAAAAWNAYATWDASWTTAYRAACWLDKYFTRTGENKQDYINELENTNELNDIRRLPMPVNIKLGDLLAEAQDYDAIMHGCNCFHGEDSGIAAQIWDKWPMARAMSEGHHDSGDFDAFGTYVSGYEQLGGFTIINAYTQFRGGACFNLDAFINILKQVNEDFTGSTIGIPMIGAGIGGGNWMEIQSALLVHAPDIKWTVVVWNG